VSRTTRRVAALLGAAVAVTASLVLTSAAADAAVLFSDNFEQPTYNIWIAGGTWSVVSEDGSMVYKQSSAANFPYAFAGAGSVVGTSVSARVKPTSALGTGNIVALGGRYSDPNNLYYVGFHGANLEIGQQSWGKNVVLATKPFQAAVGTWYTLNLSFLTAGTVTGSVTGPGGVSASVSAADPGGPKVGDHVGFWMTSASASFDDITLSNTAPPPPPPTGTCPVQLTFSIGVDYGTQFSATLLLKNISSAAVAPPFTLSWRFQDGQHMLGLSNADWYEVGPVVTVKPAFWYPSIPPGGTSTATIFISATDPSRGHPPANVTYNGLPCTFTWS
jgi:hypothetical protein